MENRPVKKIKQNTSLIHGNREHDTSILFTKNPVFLSKEQHQNVLSHCNSVYTGSRIRVWGPFTNAERGCVAYVHWLCSLGIFVEWEDNDRNEFIQVRPGSRFVVDHTDVKVGALRVLCRKNTDDIRDAQVHLKKRDVKKHYSMVMLNDIYYRFPTADLRKSYNCQKFKMTCYCDRAMRPKLFFCSSSNEKNRGRPYYGCHNRDTWSPHCDFFVWKNEFDHEIDEQCKCGRHTKLIEYPKGTGKKYLVCYNRHREGPDKGCNLLKQV